MVTVSLELAGNRSAMIAALVGVAIRSEWRIIAEIMGI